MKQVAGTLRLELAQYRELAAFAQFGSDLDPATKAQIDRGERTTEVLKQPQYSPFPVEEQIEAIFIAVKGYLDDIAVEEVVPFEDQLIAFLRNSHPEIGKAILEKKNAQLRAAIEEFKARYKAAKSENVQG